MRRRRLFLAIAALLAAAGLWFARSTRRSDESVFHESSMAVGPQTPGRQPTPGQIDNPPAQLAPPDPTRRFRDFTPEQRVEFARKGHGPGG